MPVLESTRDLLRAPTGLRFVMTVCNSAEPATRLRRPPRRRRRASRLALTASQVAVELFRASSRPGHRTRTTTQALRNLPTVRPRVQTVLTQVAVMGRQLIVSSCHVLASFYQYR